jgi:hypothetical protein
MPSFAVSIALLGLLQAALVALPGRLPPLPLGLADLRSRWWALVPALSILVVIVAVNFYEGSATFLTYLALVTVPPLAALALGVLVRGARPGWALAAVPLFAVAWAGVNSLAGEAAATLLSGLACISLGWLLVSIVPALWLRLGVYAMAAVDAWLVAGDLLQGPNSVLSVASPAADLPRLQAVHFGSAAMGFGDLFVAGLVGCLLASSAAVGPISGDMERFAARRQLLAAGLVAAFALGFDLLFFAVPVAVALALLQRLSVRRPGGRARAPRGRAQAAP